MIIFAVKINSDVTNNTYYCAMILKKGSSAPVWIPLCEESRLQALTRRANGISDDEFVRQLYSSEKGTELYRMIWQPLEKELQDIRTVYYSPSGILHQIAFAALPESSGFLSEKYDLRLVSSAREVARLKKETSGTLTQEGTAALYGGLYFNVDRETMIAEAKKAVNLPRMEGTAESMMIAAVLPKNTSRGGVLWEFLPGTRTEVENICGYMNERNIPNRLYTGAAGNEESFKNLGGTSAGIIHLATHGFFLGDVENNDYNRDMLQQLGGGGRKGFENPLLRSGLLLAGANRAWRDEELIEGVEDGILTADEISQMNLVKTKLVVLSACQTGLGEVKNSEGVFGLQRAFKLAGVESLIMTLWEVDDGASEEMMSAFYNQWLSGKTKREAFTEAQRQVREKYTEAWYWAGVVMMD